MGSSNGQTPPFKRLPPEIRQAVVDDLKTGEYGRNEIARRNKVGQSTVTMIAREEGLDPNFKTTVTKTANDAMVAQLKSRRERLKHDLLDDVQRLRVRAWSEWSRQVVTKEGIERLREDLPPLPEVASAYRSIGIALDGFFKLEALDEKHGDSTQGARDFLLDLREQMGKVRQEFEDRTGVAFDSPEARDVIQGEIVRRDGEDSA